MLREVGEQDSGLSREVACAKALEKRAQDLAAARRLLEGFEVEALAGVAHLLADTAESLARTVEAMKAAQRGRGWTTSRQLLT